MTGPAAPDPAGADPTIAAPDGRTRRLRGWRRRHGCLFWGLLGTGVVVLVVVGLVAAVVVYTRGHQELDLPPDGQPIPTSPPVTQTTPAVAVSDLSIKQGDTQRHVAIVTPPEIAAGERLPLVVLLHGHGGNADAVVTQGGWKERVIADRFIMAAPDGISQSWNAGGCCRLATTLGIEDVAFLDAVIADLARRPTVDPARIYLAGVSNGGMMTYRYLCDHADRIAAAASVEGTNVSGCTPNRPLPLLHVAGTADRVVPYRGGRSTIGTILGPGTFPSVPSSMAKLAAADGCRHAAPTTDLGGGVRTRRWTGCSDGATVQLDTVDDLGHDYPKGEPFDATDAILGFFGLER